MHIVGSLQRYIDASLRFIVYRWFWRMKLTAQVTLILNALTAALLLAVFYEMKKEEDRQCLALNIYHEARGESLAGQIAVARNVLNRVMSPAYPKTICKVVYQPWQYSWTMVPNLRAVPYEKIKGSRSDIIAREVLAGKWGDITDGATHYFASYLRKKNKAPKWYLSMESVGVIGAHEFYRDPKALPQSAVVSPPAPKRKPAP